MPFIKRGKDWRASMSVLTLIWDATLWPLYWFLMLISILCRERLSSTREIKSTEPQHCHLIEGLGKQQDRDKAFLRHFPRAGKWFNSELLRGGQRDFCTWLFLDYLMPRAFLHLLMNFTASWLLPPPFLVLPFLTILTSGILSFHIFWQALFVCTFSLPSCHSKILISTLPSHLQPLKLKVFFLHH